jgi:hypothetical protein
MSTQAQRAQSPHNPYRRGSSGSPVGRVAVARQQPRTRHEEAWRDPDGNFNPVTAGARQQFERSAQAARGSARDDVSRAIGNRYDRMFDRTGTLNAYDNKDALTQIAFLMQNAVKSASGLHMQRQARASESVMERKARFDSIHAAMTDSFGEGFAIVGQELLLPIKDILDYEGWARKVLRVRPLAQGELFRISKDVRAVAFVVGQDGQSIESRVYGKYIQPSEFKITSFPSVDIEDIYQMNYDVLDRVQDTARQEIELREDSQAQKLMDRASSVVNSVTTFTTMGTAAFEDVRYQVERHRLMVEMFLINRQELSDIVKTMSGTVDPVTERELLLAGYIGSYLNAQILTAAGTGVQEVVPAGTFYACTGPDTLGEMGIRIELFSEPYNKYAQQETAKGWCFLEMCGFGLPNARSIAKGTK